MRLVTDMSAQLEFLFNLGKFIEHGISLTSAKSVSEYNVLSIYTTCLQETHTTVKEVQYMHMKLR